MNELPQTSNRRQQPRLRTLKRGKIIYNQRCSVLDCKVLNQSSTGARIDVLSVKELPGTFEMRLGPEPHVHVARVVWQKGNVVGIEWAG
jgi:hypothetical protein